MFQGRNHPVAVDETMIRHRRRYSALSKGGGFRYGTTVPPPDKYATERTLAVIDSRTAASEEKHTGLRAIGGRDHGIGDQSVGTLGGTLPVLQ